MPTGFNLGPITIHFYGLIIMIGVLVALGLAGRQAQLRGKDPEFLLDAFPWVLLAGLVGARIWHILTPPQSMVRQGITTRFYLTHLEEAVAVWKGGLGIYGAVIGGALALWIYSSLKKESFLLWADILAPGVALAQAIGRWGNFINQEVYGYPTQLPWAIYIDPAHRLAEYQEAAFYHPLFLYESLWSLLNMAVLLVVSARYRQVIRRGNLFLGYVVIYGLGRFGLEFLRLDISSAGGVNINQFFMLAVVFVVGVVLIVRQRSSGLSFETNRGRGLSESQETER